MPDISLSGPLLQNIMVYRGDSGRFRITVQEEDTTPINVSTATWDADIRYKATDADPIAQFDVVPVSGDTSSVDVILTSDQSELLDKACVYDVEMRLAGEVVTLVTGNILITQDVSRP